MAENKALIRIDATEYGLDETQAREVERAFSPMLSKMVELEDEFNRVVNLPISPDACQEARSLRLEYVRIRTGTAKIHKAAKAFYLAGGRFVDGWKNAQHFASQGKEEKLRAIEDHYENLEKERIAKLQAERARKLSKYDPGYTPEDLGMMTDEVWGHYIAGARLAHEQRIEAERKAEEERIAKEKAEAEERERVRKENERLRAENERRRKAEEAAKQAAEKARVEAEAKLKAEREAQEKQMAEAAEKIRKAEEARKKIEADLLARQRAEEEAKRAVEAEAMRAKSASDIEKLSVVCQRLRDFELPVCTTEAGIKTVAVVEKKLGVLADYVESQLG